MLRRTPASSIIDLRPQAIQLLLSLAEVLDTVTKGTSPEEFGLRDVMQLTNSPHQPLRRPWEGVLCIPKD